VWIPYKITPPVYTTGGVFMHSSICSPNSFGDFYIVSPSIFLTVITLSCGKKLSTCNKLFYEILGTIPAARKG
jgi:hypothetical protein